MGRTLNKLRKSIALRKLVNQVAISTHSWASILSYVPKSRCKEGELPFIKVANGDAEDKAIKKAN